MAHEGLRAWPPARERIVQTTRQLWRLVYPALGLQRRIMLHVAVGSICMVLLFSYTAHRALDDSTQLIFAERLHLANLLGEEVAPYLSAMPGGGLRVDDPERVAALLKLHAGPMHAGVADYQLELVDHSGEVVTATVYRSERANAEHRQLLALYLERGVPGVVMHTPAGTNRTHLVAYAPLPGLPGGIIVEQGRDAALVLPHNLLNQMGALGGSFLVAGLFVAWWTTRKVAGPLTELRDVTGEIAAGNLNTRVPQVGQDEVRELAAAFETMRLQLQESHTRLAEANRELERRVAERTEQLTQRNRELAAATEKLQEREVERTDLLRKLIQAQEDERRSMAQELHDEVLQSLVTVLRQLDALDEAVGDRPAVAVRVQSTRTNLEDQIAAVRDFTKRLRPPALEDLGLAAALQRLLSDLGAHSDMQRTLDVSGSERRLPPDMELGLFRIAQEAVHNVERHAEATELRVSLAFQFDRVQLQVRDNGRGFSPSEARRKTMERGNLGMRGMEERAALLGGQLELISSPGRGTVLSVTVPLLSE